MTAPRSTAPAVQAVGGCPHRGVSSLDFAARFHDCAALSSDGAGLLFALPHVWIAAWRLWWGI